MRVPSTLDMVKAAGLSGLAWIQSSIVFTFSKSYKKSYLFLQRTQVLMDDDMRQAMTDWDNPPDHKSRYHHGKDMWPTFIEIATGQRGSARIGEEATSKYMAYCGLLAGAALATLLWASVVLLGLIIRYLL